MAKVILENHSAVNSSATRSGQIAYLYGDDADESEFLRTGKSVWLEIKSDNCRRNEAENPRFRCQEARDTGPPPLLSSPRGDKSCGWSESTRTSPSMKGTEKARTWKSKRIG